MKQMKNFMALLAVALIFSAILVGSCTAQTSMDYLKVKGTVLNDYQADIYLYAQDENGTWNEVSRKSNKSKYSYRLATNKNYRIVFVGHGAPTKTIHVQSGDPGMFIEYVDIDFGDKSEKHACMYQTDEYSYEFLTEPKIFTASLE